MKLVWKNAALHPRNNICRQFFSGFSLFWCYLPLEYPVVPLCSHHRSISVSDAAALLEPALLGNTSPSHDRGKALSEGFLQKTITKTKTKHQLKEALRFCLGRVCIASVLESSGHANAESFKKCLHPHLPVVWAQLLTEPNMENEVNELSFINNR